MYKVNVVLCFLHQGDGWWFWEEKDDEHMHDFWLSVMITKIHGIKKSLMWVYSHMYNLHTGNG